MDSVQLIRKAIGPLGNEVYNLEIMTDQAGAVWASNRFWTTRAQQIAPLMERYNLRCDDPGRYLVDKSSVRKLDDWCAMSSLMQMSRFTTPLERAEIDGFPAFVHLDDMRIAVLTTPDGSHIGVHEHMLDWVLGGGMYKHLVWDGDAIGVTEDQREKVSDAHYDLGGKDIGREYQDGAVFVDAEYRVKETLLVGVVTRFRLSCKHGAAASGGTAPGAKTPRQRASSE